MQEARRGAPRFAGWRDVVSTSTPPSRVHVGENKEGVFSGYTQYGESRITPRLALGVCINAFSPSY